MKHIAAGFVTVLVLAGPVHAANRLNEVLTELQTREKSISSIRFKFEQEIFFTQMNTQSSVGGTALFAKDGKLQIKKSHPDKQVTVSDGKKVWVFNPAFNQVWEGSAKKWMESTVMPKGLVPLNNYVEDLRENFDLKVKDLADTGEVQIDAVPKKKNLDYRLELHVSTQSWLPMKTVYESESARVVTRWSDHEINPEISDATFRFVAPKGTDVIPLN